jgi:hypothetical protein
MRRDEVHAPIIPGLPVLDELGDALNSNFTRREQQRRRRHQAAGVLAGVITAVVAATVAIVGGGAEQARATQIATGRTAAASWRLMLIESNSGVCLQLRPRDSTDSHGSCRAPGRLDSTIARARINGQAFVYGFFSEAAPAIRLSATGEIERLAAQDLLPAARDPRSRGSGFVRSVSTRPLPPKVRETRSLPAGARVFVAAIPRGRDRTVIVEPRGAGNRRVVIRVPHATSR